MREDVRTGAGWGIALPRNVSPALLVGDAAGNSWISYLLKGVRIELWEKGQPRQGCFSQRCNTPVGLAIDIYLKYGLFLDWWLFRK